MIPPSPKDGERWGTRRRKNKTEILRLGFPILEKADGSPPSLRMTASCYAFAKGRRKVGHPRQFPGIHGSDERKIVMRSLRFLLLFLLVGSLHSAFTADKPSNQS